MVPFTVHTVVGGVSWEEVQGPGKEATPEWEEAGCGPEEGAGALERGLDGPH